MTTIREGQPSYNNSKNKNNTCYAPDELVVNYHDACIYGRDLALLESPTAWLNDACLHFALQELQQQQQQSPLSSNSDKTTTTLFLDPAVVAFFMHQCHDKDEYQDFIHGACPGLTDDDGGVQCLVVPINDTLTQQHWAVPGLGSHWSLLVLSIQQSIHNDGSSIVGYHFDSMSSSSSSSSNLHVAQAVANKILRAAALTAKSSWQQQRATMILQACRTPQQGNGYDCGVHVIAAAQAIATTTTSGSDADKARRHAYETKLAQILDKDNACWELRQALAARIRKLANQETTC